MRTLYTTALTLLMSAPACQQAPAPEAAQDDRGPASHGHAGHDHGNGSDAPLDTAAFISHRIAVRGDVETPLDLTMDDLRALPVHEGEEFDVVCQSGALMNKMGAYKGVLLRDVLEKAKLVQENHKDRNFYFVARATDGYMATFSWAEIFNHAVGDSTFILFERDGQPLGAKGDFVLISTTDKKTGPRHVYWLNGVDVHKVRPGA